MIIYPGHPLVLAVLIIKNYPTLEDAYVRTERGCPVALEDENIPGAGGCVYTALDAIKYVTDKLFTIDQAVEWCKNQWVSIDDNVTQYPERYAKGADQAEEYEGIFRGMMKGRGYA